MVDSVDGLKGDFNPRPPRGGRRVLGGIPAKRRTISIHAPREGGDGSLPKHLTASTYFNPRPPRGGRPLRQMTHPSKIYFNPRPPRGGRHPVQFSEYPCCPISIHAPREGGDCCTSGCCTRTIDFNPRPPRGGRRRSCLRLLSRSWIFQSTPPARGATSNIFSAFFRSLFQSTPPARGATFHGILCHHAIKNFNPRPPRGGRQQRCTVLPADL